MGRVKRIWYLPPMRAAMVLASLLIRAVSPEPPLLAHTSSESRGTFRQKARSLATLNGWTCAVKICNDGMLEDTNSLDAPLIYFLQYLDYTYSHPHPLYNVFLFLLFFVLFFVVVFFVCWPTGVQLLVFFSSGGVVRHPRDLQVSVATRCFCRVLIFVSS